MNVANIRAVTFPIRSECGSLTPSQWERQIRLAIIRANEVFFFWSNLPERYRIFFRISELRHLEVEESMRLLTQNVQDEWQLPAMPAPNPKEYWIRERNMNRISHSGRPSQSYAGFFVRRFPFGSRNFSSRTSDINPQPVTFELKNILHLNYNRHGIRTYWVPGFNDESVYAQAFMPEFQAGINNASEGIVMSFGVRSCTLAHELGHLLMRGTHSTFEELGGSPINGSAPPSNLMHQDYQARTGTELTRGQGERMLEVGTRYIR